MSRLAEAVQALAGSLDEAKAALEGDSNDAEHEALFEIVQTAAAVIEAWEN